MRLLAEKSNDCSSISRSDIKITDIIGRTNTDICFVTQPSKINKFIESLALQTPRDRGALIVSVFSAKHVCYKNKYHVRDTVRFRLQMTTYQINNYCGDKSKPIVANSLLASQVFCMIVESVKLLKAACAFLIANSLVLFKDEIHLAILPRGVF